MCICVYSRIKSKKSPSFCLTTFSAGLTNLTVLLPLLHDCNYSVSRQILAPPPLRLTYTHTTSRTLPTCNIMLGWLTLPAPEAGDLVELFLLYRVWKVLKKLDG